MPSLTAIFSRKAAYWTPRGKSGNKSNLAVPAHACRAATITDTTYRYGAGGNCFQKWRQPFEAFQRVRVSAISNMHIVAGGQTITSAGTYDVSSNYIDFHGNGGGCSADFVVEGLG